MNIKDISIGIDLIKGKGFDATVKAFDLVLDAMKELNAFAIKSGIEGVKLAANFEAQKNALSVFAGGVNLARQELEAIDKAARNTAGLRLEDAEKGYVQLRNLGFQAKTTENLIVGLAKQRLISNADELSVQRVITNFTQISSSTARFGQATW